MDPCIAVVGAGYWGRNLVRVFHRLGALRVVCDRDAGLLGSLDPVKQGVGAEVAFNQILRDEGVRAVAIATPAELHLEMAREALLAGKDVFVEKPLALTERDGAALTALAAERGRVLMVGHLLWYHPAVLKLRELIEAGELGRIQYLYSNRLNLGKIRREENILWSFAPHDISVILGLLGEMPAEVQAQGGNYLHQGIADVTVSLLSFASGVRAHVFVSWLHPFKEQKLVVVGDRAMAVFDDVAPWDRKLVVYHHHIEWKGHVPVPAKGAGEPVALEEGEPLLAECAHFLECLESRSTPRTDGAEGLRVLAVLNRCQRALESGRAEEVKAPGAPRPWFAHPTAVVDEGASVGAGTKIWHFSHVLSGSRVGERCILGQNVVVGPDVTVGNGCKIQNNVSVYKGVTLEEDVFCGPSMVFTNVINPRAAIVRKHEFRPTLVRRGATIGANATVLCGHTIGEHALVGAGAVVTRDVPAHALVVGNPARQIGWACRCGVTLPLEPGSAGKTTCTACGLTYAGDGRSLALAEEGE